jgi:hypothetical protein
VKRDPERELERFIASRAQHADVVQATATLRALPDAIDPKLASLAGTAVIRMCDGGIPTGFRRVRLPPAVIRDVLARDAAGMEHLFLRLAVPEAAKPAVLVKAWQRALTALVDLAGTGSWGSKARRDTIRALARDRTLLPALQGTVANRKDVPLDMLAVLVADGSAASIDALVPHLDPALVARDERLDRLAKLRTYAKKTPVLDALLGEVDGTLTGRRAASPALAIGQMIGLDSAKAVYFVAAISSPATTISIRVTIDSRAASWFEVYASAVDVATMDITVTAFTATQLERDELGLGRCAAAELPAWLARTAKRLGLTWSTPEIVRSNVRGAKRERIARWLVAH